MPGAASNVTMTTTESRSDDTVVIAASVTANFVFLLIIACIVVTAALCAVRRKARMKRLETDPPSSLPQFMYVLCVTYVHVCIRTCSLGLPLGKMC